VIDPMSPQGLATLIAAVITAVAWIPRRFLASARMDRQRRRLSLATIGFGAPIMWLLDTPLAIVAGPWFVVAWGVLAYLSISFGLAYPLLHAGDAVRAAVPAHLGRWLLASLGSISLTVLFLTGALNSNSSSEAVATFALVFAMGAVEAAAFVWGLAGRPDLLRVVRR
jgi:hypothetical protein